MLLIIQSTSQSNYAYQLIDFEQTIIVLYSACSEYNSSLFSPTSGSIIVISQLLLGNIILISQLVLCILTVLGKSVLSESMYIFIYMVGMLCSVYICCRKSVCLHVQCLEPVSCAHRILLIFSNKDTWPINSSSLISFTSAVANMYWTLVVTL